MPFRRGHSGLGRRPASCIIEEAHAQDYRIVDKTGAAVSVKASNGKTNSNAIRIKNSFLKRMESKAKAIYLHTVTLARAPWNSFQL